MTSEHWIDMESMNIRHYIENTLSAKGLPEVNEEFSLPEKALIASIEGISVRKREQR